MKKIVALPLLTTLLVACGGDDMDVLRSSRSVATGELQATIIADVHRHAATDTSAETYSTELFVQLNAIDHDEGYPYTVELAEGDSLSATVDGATVPLPASYFPSEGDRLVVAYIEDFDQVAGGTELTVTLARDSDGTSSSTPVLLLDETPFAIAGEPASVTLDDDLVVDWTPITDYQYHLRFVFSCERSDGSPTRFAVDYPNFFNQDDLVSPFTLDISEHVGMPGADTQLDNCKITTVLQSCLETNPEADPLAAIQVQSTRRQYLETPLLLETVETP